MPALRYADQERLNIRAAESRAKQSAALDASIAKRRAHAGKMANWVPAPETATSAGTAGQIAYDDSFIYVCVATDTWVRTALATW